MPRRPRLFHPALRRDVRAALGAALLFFSLGLAKPVLCHPAPAAARPPEVADGSVRFTRSYGWQALEARQLVLWAGVEEPYVVDLAPGCPDLRQSRVSAITTHNRRLTPRLDSLQVDGRACPLERIQPASGGTLRALGVRREAARSLAVMPAAPPPPPRKSP